MSTPAEALAPPDADVSPEVAQPEGAEQPKENAADPSPAADSKSSETAIEPETKRLNERFAELTKYRRDAERDAQFWRDRALRLEQSQTRPPTAPQPVPQAPEKLKTLADFNFDEGQHQQYLLQRAAAVSAEAAKRELRAEQERVEEQRTITSYVTRAKDFAKEHDDFKEVSEYAPISDGVAKMLMRSEQGPELAYYLGKNPDLAVEISNLPAQAAAFELGGLAYRLKFERDAAKKANLKVSAAPPPTPSIEGARESVKVVSASDPDSDKLSVDQWLKLRQKEVNKRRSK